MAQTIRKYFIVKKMIIKMVRGHSSLRQLRSDLTEETIARMQQERPAITFVREQFRCFGGANVQARVSRVWGASLFYFHLRSYNL